MGSFQGTMSPGVLKKKLFITLIKDSKEDYSRRTNAMQFCSCGKSLTLIPDTIRTSGNVQPRNWNRGQWVENY